MNNLANFGTLPYFTFIIFTGWLIYNDEKEHSEYHFKYNSAF